jgi:hypothetical protein
MTSISQIRADDYRSRAKAATVMAEASVLQQVRERHAFAAFAWTELANAEERRTSSLSRRFGRAAHGPSMQASADKEDISCSA